MLGTTSRACSGCGTERKEIGSEESWQIKYIPGHFERREHVRKKYGCAVVSMREKTRRSKWRPSRCPACRAAGLWLLR